jgi:hypothetical protein
VQADCRRRCESGDHEEIVIAAKVEIDRVEAT